MIAAVIFLRIQASNNLTLCFSVLLEKPHESAPKGGGLGGPTDQDHKGSALPVDAETPLVIQG